MNLISNLYVVYVCWISDYVACDYGYHIIFDAMFSCHLNKIVCYIGTIAVTPQVFIKDN
jgi:hypothetical protein